MVKKKVKKKAGKKKKASAGPEPYKSVFEGFDKQVCFYLVVPSPPYLWADSGSVLDSRRITI
jgi:hypothetical protein